VNAFVASRYDEIVRRLALGVELVDPVRRRRVHSAVAVVVERPLGVSLVRHKSALHTLTYAPPLDSPVQLHVSDPTRRFVARRLELPFVTEQEVLDGEEAAREIAVGSRARRVALFPGVAYDLPARTTALRGRVVVRDPPVRWARVEATLTGRTDVRWRAHVDDRGEFLLVVGPDTTNFGDLVSPLEVDVTVVAPDPQAADAKPPLEVAPAPGDPDDVSPGEARPDGYDPGLVETRTVPLPLGRVTSDLDPYVPS
jgi:hypothetical protein